VVVGDGGGASEVAATAASARIPTFHGRLLPDQNAVAALSGKRVLAFAGIADPEKFFHTLDAAGIEAPLRRAFPDHHRYAAAEASRLLAEASLHDLTLVATEKDVARLDGVGPLAELRARVQSFPVTLALDDQEGFVAFLLGRIKNRA
jgi:tetraacyldisaccharide 4'-kinase